MTTAPKERAIGILFILCGLVMLVLGALVETRTDLGGLKAVTGTVVESTSINRGRSGGLELRIVLAQESGRIELLQDQAGDLSGRIRRGQSVRAWVDEKPLDVVGGVPVHTVWQVESGSGVPIALEAMTGGRKTWRYFAFLTGIVALMGGLVALRTAAGTGGLAASTR